MYKTWRCLRYKLSRSFDEDSEAGYRASKNTYRCRIIQRSEQLRIISRWRYAYKIRCMPTIFKQEIKLYFANTGYISSAVAKFINITWLRCIARESKLDLNGDLIIIYSCNVVRRSLDIHLNNAYGNLNTHSQVCLASCPRSVFLRHISTNKHFSYSGHLLSTPFSKS